MHHHPSGCISTNESSSKRIFEGDMKLSIAMVAVNKLERFGQLSRFASWFALDVLIYSVLISYEFAAEVPLLQYYIQYATARPSDQLLQTEIMASERDGRTSRMLLI